MAASKATGLSVINNPLWRPIWGLWPDLRFVRSPALGLAIVLALLLGISHFGSQWLHSLWSQPGDVTAAQRRIYRFLMEWRHIGLNVCLLFFGVLLLHGALERRLPLALSTPQFGTAHLLVVCLCPLAVIWSVVELMGWVDQLELARRLAEPGDRLLWLIRRPGGVTFLTDPGPAHPIVFSHNILAGAIVLLGYVVFFLWWAWVLVSVMALRVGFLRSLLFAHLIFTLTLLVAYLLKQVQGNIPIFHPFAVWLFPPGTATLSESRALLLSPVQHFRLYASMHLAVLLVELGLVGCLHRALRGAERQLWAAALAPPPPPAEDEGAGES